ncbi:MAG: transcription antitermination factor NusB [Acidobacteria bacterium]|nr:transcription antitermination factor NusB [Acidobacteriota bacterium]
MSSRRKERELALQLLFQQDCSQVTADEILEIYWEVNPVDLENREFAEFLFRKASEHRSLIDDLIGRNAQHWRLERMTAVDRNILRMAVSEFLYAETPQVVVLDEAIEIARRFSTSNSSQFVNGVLDAIREEINHPPVSENHHG